MDTTDITNPSISAAEESIRRAKPKTFYIINDRGYTAVLLPAEFKKLKPQAPRVEDVVRLGDKITPKLIAKMQAALDNPPYYEDDEGESYPRKAIEKAKEVAGIAFQYAGYSAVLLSNGLLKVGCQKHELGVWATTLPEENGEGLAGYLAGALRSTARDALIPVLKEKLKQIRGGAK